MTDRETSFGQLIGPAWRVKRPLTARGAGNLKINPGRGLRDDAAAAGLAQLVRRVPPLRRVRFAKHRVYDRYYAVTPQNHDDAHRGVRTSALMSAATGSLSLPLLGHLATSRNARARRNRAAAAIPGVSLGKSTSVFTPRGPKRIARVVTSKAGPRSNPPRAISTVDDVLAFTVPTDEPAAEVRAAAPESARVDSHPSAMARRIRARWSR